MLRFGIRPNTVVSSSGQKTVDRQTEQCRTRRAFRGLEDVRFLTQMQEDLLGQVLGFATVPQDAESNTQE
jgi:hypothetical protein